MISDYSTIWISIKRGEIAALKNLFIETNQALVKYSFRICKDNFLAEEVVQDIFVNVWNNREHIEISGSLKSYLYQSVHNLTINKLKQLKNQHNSASVLVSDETWQFLKEFNHFDDFIIEKLEADDLEKLIERAIETLPQQCREIFKLSKLHSLTNTEIATKLNISVSTVKTQIYRALDKIRDDIFK